MSRKALARHNVVALVPDDRAGRRLLAELHEAGVDSNATSMRGRRRIKMPGWRQAAPGNVQSLAGSGRMLLTGSLLGGLAGVLTVGILAGALALVMGPQFSVAGALALGAVVGAVMGSGVGAMLGLEMGGRRAAMLEQSLTPMLQRSQSRAAALVGVHTNDEETADAAEQAMMASDLPVAVERAPAQDSFHAPGWFASLLGRTIPSGAADSPGGRVVNA